MNCCAYYTKLVENRNRQKARPWVIRKTHTVHTRGSREWQGQCLRGTAVTVTMPSVSTCLLAAPARAGSVVTLFPRCCFHLCSSWIPEAPIP